MSYLLYLLGVVIAIVVYLYVLSAFDTGKKQLRKLTSEKAEGHGGPSVRVEPDNIFIKKRRGHPGERVCPLCGSVLTSFESLYASQIKTPAGPKILIHGCRYCCDLKEEMKGGEKKPQS
jgi:hypothetical protein